MSASQRSNFGERALLPEGLRDDLPPWAEYEADTVDRLMACFAASGYERVAPPLVEFEESLLAGAGASQAKAMFRVQDPESQRMMAMRADITPQVARVAATRLARAPRPLRLSYAGHVLRVKGSQLRPARQFRQAGVELIGAASMEADLEVILLAADALMELGISRLSVDLVSPTFVPALARGLALSEDQTHEACRALDAKDGGALRAFPARAAETLAAVMNAAGALDSALARLQALTLAGEAAEVRERLVALARALAARAPDLTITIDPGEVRGFEYQTGVGFAFFAEGERSELGRGGRYDAAGPDGASAEDAVGFSMYLDTLLRAVPAPRPKARLFLPAEAPAEAAELRAAGWRTLRGLEPAADIRAEARRLNCTHVLEDGQAVPLND